MQQLDIAIKDTLFDPIMDTNTVSYYKDSEGKFRYKVWLYVDGPKLFYVDYVIYKLHSSFINPERKVFRDLSNTRCALQIWTWGTFNVQAIVYLKTGDIITLNHYLNYDNQLKAKGANLRYINTGSYAG